MFVRLVYESFRRQKRRKLLAGAAITLGVTVATAMIAVATDIGDKMNRELRTIGANLLITPQEDTLDVEIGGVNLKPPSDGAFLNEADLPKIKGTFWHNNITGFAPVLPVNVTLERDGKTENLTLLGTYFAKKFRLEKRSSQRACDRRIRGGRFRGRGRGIARKMFWWERGWRRGFPRRRAMKLLFLAGVCM
jgi:putative ABC transport system permease protein